MDLPFLIDLVSTLAVVFGIAFGLIQLRQYRLSRKREASLFILNSHQTREFVGGLWEIMSLPDGLTRDVLEGRLGDDFGTLGLVMST